MEAKLRVSSEIADNLKSMGVSEENKEIVLSLLENYDDTMPPQYNFSELDSSDVDTQTRVSEKEKGDDTATSAEEMPPPLSPNNSPIVSSQEVIRILSDPKYERMIWNKGDFLTFLQKSSVMKEKKKSLVKKVVEVDQKSKLTEYKLVFKDLIGCKSDILYSSVIDPISPDYKKKVLEAFRLDTEYQKSKNLIMKRLNKCVSISF